MFTRGQGNAVIMSNLGLIGMGVFLYALCSRFGTGAVMKLYGVPWLLVTHWFIMITYLHHTDPALPHYRKGQWNFQRGAAATIDRDFLGWQGRFFLHHGKWRLNQRRLKLIWERFSGALPRYTSLLPHDALVSRRGGNSPLAQDYRPALPPLRCLRFPRALVQLQFLPVRGG